jgi:hypothetical protein
MGYHTIWTFKVGSTAVICEEDEAPFLDPLVHEPHTIESIESGAKVMSNLRSRVLRNDVEIGRGVIRDRVRSALDLDEYTYHRMGDDAYRDVVWIHREAYRSFRNEAVRLAIKDARKTLADVGA